MKRYSVYHDMELYRKGRIDMSEEKIPEHPIFAVREGEYRTFSDEEKVSSIFQTLQSIEKGQISETEIQIICLVACNGYMTTRQIFEFLTLMGYEVKQEKILNMIKKLSRNRFLLISYFSIEERKTSYVVVSLDRYGEQVARQRRVEYLSFSPFERIDEVWIVKRALACVQIRLAWLKSGLPVAETAQRPVIKNEEVPGMVVRPGVMIRLESGETLLYEVVRSQPFWKKMLADKLARYETVFRNIARTDYEGAEEPVLILCAENEMHAAGAGEIAEKSGLKEDEVFLTDDLQFFGKNFYRSLYHFDRNGKRQCFEFAV